MPSITKQTTKRPVKRKGVLDRIGKVPFEAQNIKLNLYGKSGTGKTTLWSTFPGPTLAIVCSSIGNTGELISVAPKDRKKIRAVTLEASSEMADLMEYVRDTGIRTVVLDHATGLQDLILKEILGLNEAPVQLSWGLATQQQYGQLALQMKERLRSLLDLPCNVVVVAQEREFNADSESSVIMPYVASALTPSVVGWLNPACDYIVETFLRPEMGKRKNKVSGKEQTVKTGRVEYCLRVAPHEVYTTKFRRPRGGKELPDCIVDPTYDKIMALLQGE